MNRNGIKVLALALSCVLAMSGCTANAENGSDKKEFQGTLEARSVDINTKVPGKIAQVLVEEGQTVKAGDPIAIIDAKDLAAKKDGLSAQAQAALAAVEAAKAQVNAAEAVLDKAKNGARSQEITKAQANYDITKKSYDRIASLFNAGAASQAQFDEVETKLNIAKQDLDMAKEGARKEDISAAQAQVAAASSNVVAAQEKYQQSMAGVQEVETYLTDAAIKAPIDGIVTMINTDQGEIVSTGMSLATITDLSDVWVELEVDELQLPKFKEGQDVKVKVAAYKNQLFEGKVMRLNPNPDYAVKKASNENGEFDLVSYGIKVKILKSDKVLRPGMTSFVELQ